MDLLFIAVQESFEAAKNFVEDPRNRHGAGHNYRHYYPREKWYCKSNVSHIIYS